MSDASEIIARFGGAASLAAEFGLSESTVRNWPARGIPYRLHLPLLALARRKGITLSEDDLTAPGDVGSGGTGDSPQEALAAT